MDQYKFECSPVANADSIVAGDKYRFTVIDDKVFRYEWAEDGVFEDRASTFAVNRDFPRPDFRVNDSEDQLEIVTPKLHLTYDKQRFSRHGFSVFFTSKQTEWGAFWNYGDAQPANLGGTARTLDGVEGRCELGLGVLSRAGFSVLDDSESMLFDGKGFVTSRRSGDRIDGYIFAYGYDYRGAMKSFYAISGSQPPVPRWALGNWWSRYHRYDEIEYLGLMDQFKAQDVPLSVAVIDMDWHLVSDPKVQHVGWTGYTWDQNLFPDPERFLKALHDRGLKTTLNDHPHAGVYSFEDAYEEMAKVLKHDTSQKAPIRFDATSPEYMHAFFNVLHRKIEEQGCDFWWIDWQQGGHSRIPGMDPLWLLNHFQYQDQILVKPQNEALIFSRYAGPGSHRYPIGFSGDSVATWSSLEFQSEFTATASNIGYGWWSHDIGGHLAGSRDDESTTRWVQLGVFSPILRLHSTVSRWQSKEPWRYRGEYASVMRSALQLRHRLVPYIYSAIAGDSGDLPLVQPMYWHFPNLDVAFRCANQFYFGPSLIVSPVTSPRDTRTNLAKTKGWLPPGQHVDIFTGLVYNVDGEIDFYRPLHQTPVLAPLGSIIPLDGSSAPANGCPNPDEFEVIVVIGKNGGFEIIEDFVVRGKSFRNKTKVLYDQSRGTLFTTAAGKSWKFRLVSFKGDLDSLKVHVDGADYTDIETAIEYNGASPDTVLSIAKPPNDKSLIAIKLGSDPQLAVLDFTDAISDMIIDFQIENNLKDKIWQVVSAKQDISIKMARLLSLGLDSLLLGPLAELLLSNSRSAYGGCVHE